jgi:hypothetical protein
MRDYAQEFADNARLANLYENKAETALANYIHEVQQKTDNGFVKFTDESGYPLFVDTTTDCHESIYGIKSVGEGEDIQILIYTDGNPYEDMETYEDGWFYWRDYGDLEMDEVYYYVEQVNKALNN